MNIERVHKLHTGVAIAILAVSMVYFLVSLTSLPDEIGVHFGPNGMFDIYANKMFGFYPHVTGLVLLLVIQLLDLLVIKAKPNKKRTAAEGNKEKETIRLLLDSNKLCVSAFFSYWSYCVTMQNSLNTVVPRVALAFIALTIIFAVVRSIK